MTTMAPVNRVARLPTATRRPATSAAREPSSSGLIAVPIFAPIIRAIAAFRGKTPLPVSDMTSNATATLEWAAQAIVAPSSAEITGSAAIRPIRILRLGTSS